MARQNLPDWTVYWSKITDLRVLREKSNNLDDLLRGLEEKFQVKLLSGDHMQIITALEDRIEELESAQSSPKSGVQADLFDM